MPCSPLNLEHPVQDRCWITTSQVMPCGFIYCLSRKLGPCGLAQCWILSAAWVLSDYRWNERMRQGGRDGFTFQRFTTVYEQITRSTQRRRQLLARSVSGFSDCSLCWQTLFNGRHWSVPALIDHLLCDKQEGKSLWHKHPVIPHASAYDRCSPFVESSVET